MRKKIWSRKGSARGFSLIESGVVMVMLSLIGMVTLPAVKESRSQMRGASSASNLQQIGQGAAVYGFANQGRLFSYSWRAGEAYVMPGGQVRVSNTDQAASARQNEEILQRLTGRISGLTKIQSFISRIPQKRFNHLVLIDSLGESLGASKYIDPADSKQLAWAGDPLEYLDDKNTLPYGIDGFDYSGYDQDANWPSRSVVQRWTFASSYSFTPASWQQDFPNAQYAPVETTPHLFTPVGTANGQINLSSGRNISEVAYTSQKVWLYEEFDREQAGNPYFAYDFAQTEKLMFDLSVNNWASGAANSSRVEAYGSGVWKQNYRPLHQFPLPITGLGENTQLNMRFRWTFRGLRGVDYGLAQPERKPQRLNPF